jgi:hypothetical protein
MTVTGYEWLVKSRCREEAARVEDRERICCDPPARCATPAGLGRVKVRSGELLVTRGSMSASAMRGRKTRKKESPVLKGRRTLNELLDF